MFSWKLGFLGTLPLGLLLLHRRMFRLYLRRLPFLSHSSEVSGGAGPPCPPLLFFPLFSTMMWWMCLTMGSSPLLPPMFWTLSYPGLGSTLPR